MICFNLLKNLLAHSSPKVTGGISQKTEWCVSTCHECTAIFPMKRVSTLSSSVAYGGSLKLNYGTWILTRDPKHHPGPFPSALCSHGQFPQSDSSPTPPPTIPTRTTPVRKIIAQPWQLSVDKFLYRKIRVRFVGQNGGISNLCHLQ